MTLRSAVPDGGGRPLQGGSGANDGGRGTSGRSSKTEVMKRTETPEVLGGLVRTSDRVHCGRSQGRVLKRGDPQPRQEDKVAEKERLKLSGESGE